MLSWPKSTDLPIYCGNLDSPKRPHTISGDLGIVVHTITVAIVFPYTAQLSLKLKSS